MAEHPHPLHPADLEPGDRWSRICQACKATVQGGAAGLEAHVKTVHPELVGGDDG